MRACLSMYIMLVAGEALRVAPTTRPCARAQFLKVFGSATLVVGGARSAVADGTGYTRRVNENTDIDTPLKDLLPSYGSEAKAKTSVGSKFWDIGVDFEAPEVSMPKMPAPPSDEMSPLQRMAQDNLKKQGKK